MAKRLWLVLLCVTLGGAAAVTAQEGESQVDRWEFEVYVDDKRIGNHVFEVVDNGDYQQSVNVAEFRYRFLLIPAWRYNHSNTEQWADGCLQRFEARTRVNGRQMDVSGERIDESFVIDAGESRTELPPCIMSFAYWDPRFLQQPRLLNPQSGDYLDVTVERLPAESLEVHGQTVSAQIYRVQADQLELKVWYSEQDEWLALESTAKGGRVIRYELS